MNIKNAITYWMAKLKKLSTFTCIWKWLKSASLHITPLYTFIAQYNCAMKITKMNILHMYFKCTYLCVSHAHCLLVGEQCYYLWQLFLELDYFLINLIEDLN